MGDTMNLNEKQNKFISIMTKGEAAVFSEGFNESFLVQVSHYQSSVQKINPKISSVQDKDVSRFMAKKLITLDHVFGRHSGCKQCHYKCVYRDTANQLLFKPETMRYFNTFIFSIIEKPDSIKSVFPSFRDIVLKDIRDSLQKEEEVNGIMFCFLVNAGESYIRNKGRQYDLPLNRTTFLLNLYNDLINSYFAIPIKTQLSADTERYLKEFQRFYKESFATEKGPFPDAMSFVITSVFSGMTLSRRSEITLLMINS